MSPASQSAKNSPESPVADELRQFLYSCLGWYKLLVQIVGPKHVKGEQNVCWKSDKRDKERKKQITRGRESVCACMCVCECVCVRE